MIRIRHRFTDPTPSSSPWKVDHRTYRTVQDAEQRVRELQRNGKMVAVSVDGGVWVVCFKPEVHTED